jgi:ATP-dependent Lon protease
MISLQTHVVRIAAYPSPDRSGVEEMSEENDEKIIEPEVTLEPEEQDEPAASPTDGLVVAAQMLPNQLPLIPLRPRPCFPALLVPLAANGPQQMAAIRQAADSPTRAIGLVMVRDIEAEDGPENLQAVGVAAKILKILHADDDSIHVMVNCMERFSIVEVLPGRKLLAARVRYHYAPELSVNPELKAYSMAIIATLKELVQINPLYSEEIKLFLNRSSLDDPGRLADFAANLTSADGAQLQRILETFDVRKRIDMVLVLLKKELEVSRLQSKISKNIEEKVSAQQREYFLREQLKAIKKELGLEKEGKDTEREKFEKRLKKLKLNAEAQKAVDDEMEKLSLIEPHSPEYTVSRNYLDWLTSVPWGVHSRDNYNLARARRILDRDHYGLKDVKERILEFIAVGKLKGDISGSILCLVGPPGVGKTSIGHSIAAALGRRFFRFSLGGMRDEAEIKGHRRTYIGAMPGKFIQSLKTAGTANPVLMLDEIDKIGASFQGDPASALLEVLDPEQNFSFRDHYLDVPFDLSNVLFIATANQLDTIPRPLLDRMEVIRLSGYILEEKLEIARRYLIPKTLAQHGLKDSQVKIRKAALVKIIDGYAREAGVRNLENQIKKIMRRAAMAYAEQGQTEAIVITPHEVEIFLERPVFTAEELFEGTPGVVTGLAWTSLGGATLQVEATAMPSQSKGFKQTGQLGSVMVESSEIAYSYVMAHLQEYGAPSDFFDKHFVHLHVPAGATPKDGPSAGVTMTTALLSMILGRPVASRLGMTGELTLTGHVLPIGGVKEKTIAARRTGLKSLIFPAENRKDFEELPDYLKEGLTVHFARDYPDVYRVAFGESPKKRGKR